MHNWITKLEHYKVSGNMHNWIQCCLANIVQTGTFYGTNYIRSIVKYGVPQGSILEPLQYINYINDPTAVQCQ